LDKPFHANDYISRGWDYIGLTLKYQKEIEETDNLKEISFYFSYANYVGGLLQGDIEEYYDEWEPVREITSRDQVDGLRFTTKIRGNKHSNGEYFQGYKLAFIYETGTQSPFKYNTLKAEFTTQFLGMPLMIWVKTGYNSDLAQYYKKVTSFGIGFEFKTFD